MNTDRRQGRGRFNDQLAELERSLASDPCNRELRQQLGRLCTRIQWTFKGKTLDQWMKRLESRAWRIRLGTYEAIAVMGVQGSVTVPKLLTRIRLEGETMCRAQLFQTLRALGPLAADAVRPLLEFTMTKPSYGLRAALVFVAVGQPAIAPLLEVTMQLFQAQSSAGNQSLLTNWLWVLQKLERHVEDTPDLWPRDSLPVGRARGLLYKALGKNHHFVAENKSALIKDLRHPMADVRLFAARALARVGDHLLETDVALTRASAREVNSFVKESMDTSARRMRLLRFWRARFAASVKRLSDLPGGLTCRPC